VFFERDMSSVADIAVFSPDHQLTLVVEVKAKKHATAEWATQFRRNLILHGAIPAAPFFMITCLDRFFLWSNGGRGPETPPDYNAHSTELLEQYASPEDPSGIQWSDAELELAVVAWLHDVAARGEVHDHTQLGTMLRDSGLLNAIAAASINTQLRA
jgi:hypothetical protein